MPSLAHVPGENGIEFHGNYTLKVRKQMLGERAFAGPDFHGQSGAVSGSAVTGGGGDLLQDCAIGEKMLTEFLTGHEGSGTNPSRCYD